HPQPGAPATTHVHHRFWLGESTDEGDDHPRGRLDLPLELLEERRVVSSPQSARDARFRVYRHFQPRPSSATVYQSMAIRERRHPVPDLVSVIIPVRNGAATLGSQLRALAAQTYPGLWEIVIADNGSTDATAAIAEAEAPA